MRTIAIEEHFLAKGIREVMQRNASSQGGGLHPAMTAERQVKLADLGTLRLKDMDMGGIDLQVISHTASGRVSLPAGEEVRLTREANDQLAAAADELERAVRSLGLKGAMIHGSINGRFLDDPAFLPILERAVALDVPIYIHPAPPAAAAQEAYYTGFDPAVGFVLATSGWGWHSEVGMHALRLILAGVFDRLPTLQIIIGHMGEMIPFLLARIHDMLTPVAKHLQHTVPEYFLHNFHITTSGFFTDPPLLLAMQVMGPTASCSLSIIPSVRMSRGEHFWITHRSARRTKRRSVI